MKQNIQKPLKIIIIIIIVTLAIFASSKVYDFVQNTLPPTQVDITVKYSPELPCREDTPLLVTIFNGSHRKIFDTKFVLSATAANADDNLIETLARTYSKNTIIHAGDKYEGCWAYPQLTTGKYAPETLRYKVKRKIFTFEN